MLWFGVTIVESKKEIRQIEQEIRGPFDNMDSMADAIDERLQEAEAEGLRITCLQFELCTDDVPEIVS